MLVGCRRCGEHVRIDVYDTGIGIPRAQQRAVFGEFQRLEQGARVARGLGLGLSIVERIGRVLDHRVMLDSTVGRGTHFSVEVPLAPAAAPRGQLGEDAARRSARRDYGRITGMAVLCIDNDTKILDGMTTLLGGWGCRVIAVTDLADAQATLRREQATPDGLLVDYHLDHGDGLAVIAELRQACGPALPAILVTADRTAAVRAAAHAQDVQMLHKPIKPAALRALLAQWTDPARSRRRSEGGLVAPRPGAKRNPGTVARSTGAVRASIRATTPPLAMTGCSGAACGQLPTSILAAAITACVRLSTPSFCRIADTCAFTVASETPSW